MKRKTAINHSKLICDISEISGLFKSTDSLDLFLQRVVEMIADHMHSEVCSIYWCDESTRELILRATKGLRLEAVGKVKLKYGEGLTGLAVKELRPICARNASKNPNYRYFPGIGEERFESFLAVPILRGLKCIGAMVIQNLKKNYFRDEDINVFRAITAQLANTIETAQLFMSFEETGTIEHASTKLFPSELKFIKGKVGAEGFAYGKVVLYKKESSLLQYKSHMEKKFTLDDFHRAIHQTEQYLENLQQKIDSQLDDMTGLIFSAHILMLKDKNFVADIVDQFNNQIALPYAIINTTNKYSEKFDKLPNDYLREKRKDIEDVGRSLLQHLIGMPPESNDYAGCIIIAQELFPSDILRLSTKGISGIILLSGGITSHLAILSRSLGIPLIICEEYRFMDLPPRTKILLDADQGNIYVNPQSEILRSFKERESEAKRIKRISHLIGDATYTKDGTRIFLLANINLLKDIKLAKAYKFEGVGLYRTEFPFLIRPDFPTEEEQYLVYRKLVSAMPNKEITFRTLDVGGDKVLSYYNYGKENNPFLGMRSIRFSLKHENIFDQQLRAILRAGHQAHIRIMFPMISSLDEFLAAKQRVLTNINTLMKEGKPCNDRPKIGMMVELPAVIEIIEEFAQQADFLSLGTNDFIQYMLAVDRTNEKVADLYLPYHPSIVKALQKIVVAAQKYNKDISICGDMAHDEKYIFFLLGIGLRRLSIDPCYFYKTQLKIQTIDLKGAVRTTRLILRKNTIEEIKDILEKIG